MIPDRHSIASRVNLTISISLCLCHQFYLTAEAGACGFNYTDQDHGVCLHNGWVGSAYHDGCNKWVEVTLPSLGTRTVARVIEGCHGETFGCDDIYLTLSTFLDLVGGNQTFVDDGRLPG